MTNRDFALLAAKTLSDKKAQDIVIIDIQEQMLSVIMETNM